MWLAITCVLSSNMYPSNIVIQQTLQQSKEKAKLVFFLSAITMKRNFQHKPYIFAIVIAITGLGYRCQGDSMMLSYTPIENRVVSIRPSHFEKVLDSKQPLQVIVMNSTDHKPSTFFNAFSRFLLTFDFRNKSDESYLLLERICMKAAAYNHKVSGHDSINHLQLWISIVPQTDIKLQLKIAMELIHDANLEFSGIVPVFFLNYRSLRLGLETLPVVKHDILVTQYVLKSTTQNVSFGLILDSRNCYGSAVHFLEVMKMKIDTVIFLTDTEIDNDNQIHSLVYSACFLRMLETQKFNQMRTPNYGFKWSQFFTLNLANSSISISLGSANAAFLLTTWESLKMIPIIELSTAEVTPKNVTDPVMLSPQTQEAWLKHETQFSAKYTGISVYGEYDQFRAQNVIPLIWSSFCRVLIQKRMMYQGGPDKFQLFTNNLLVNLANEQVASQWIYRCGQTPTDILLVGYTIIRRDVYNFMNEYISLLANLTKTARSADIYPNVATTIIFEWNPCFGIWDDCEEPMQSVHFSPRHNLNWLLLSSVIEIEDDLITKAQFTRRPKIGISMKHQYCSKYFDGSQLSFDILRNVSGVLNTFLFKSQVHKSDIVAFGALTYSKRLIPFLEMCASDVENYYTGVTNFEVNIFFNVVVLGCNTGSQNFREIMQVARFFELMDKWAISVNRVIYIGSAVDHDSSITSQISDPCTLKDEVYLSERCDCGWWKAVPNPERINETPTVVILDKKRVALGLFEKMHLQKAATDHSPGRGSRADILMITLIPLFVVITVIATVAVVLILRYKIKHDSLFWRAESMLRSRCQKHEIHPGDAELTSGDYFAPYDMKRHEISANSFKIDPANVLGRGEFGVVLASTVIHNGAEMQTAVKIFDGRNNEKSHDCFLALKGLISEIKILSHIGHHENIVGFVGAHTHNLKKGKLFVFLELCELGSLHNFLRNSQGVPSPKSGEHGMGESELTNLVNPDQNLSFELSAELFRWSLEIASGMEYLSSKKIVHADLATRNILLNSERCAKIADFGLSRRLYSYSEYMKQEAGPLPWKWMAPECLRKMMFNESTDVWSFGILLWEIFTLGDEPYPGLSWEVNFPTLLERGMIPVTPRYNEKEMYSVMKRCWNVDPYQRPTFSDLVYIFRDRMVP